MATAPSDTISRIPLGTPIISYNRWTGFETDRFKEQFNWLSGKQVRDLTPGTVVYVDIDPLHPHGKVYGVVKGIVTAVAPGKGFTVVSYVCDGFCSGSKRIEDKAKSTDFALAIDEDALAAILEELPKAKIIDERRP